MMLPPDPQCHRLSFFRHNVNLFWNSFFFLNTGAEPRIPNPSSPGPINHSI